MLDYAQLSYRISSVGSGDDCRGTSRLQERLPRLVMVIGTECAGLVAAKTPETVPPVYWRSPNDYPGCDRNLRIYSSVKLTMLESERKLGGVKNED